MADPDKVDPIAPGPWAHIPKQYHGRWGFDYSEERKMFFVHCNGYGVCEAEDSEVCDAIVRAYNAAHGH